MGSPGFIGVSIWDGLQDLTDLFDQLRGGEWRRKYLISFKDGRVSNAIIIQEPRHQEHRHPRVFGAEIFGRFVSGDFGDVGMGD